MFLCSDLDEGGCLVDPAVADVLPVDEEKAVELLQAAIGSDGAVVLDVHDVDPRLAAVPAQPDAQLLVSLQSKIQSESTQ